MKVLMQYEIQDNKGRPSLSFWKEIDMPAAPTKSLVFDDDNFTFEPNREVIYSIKDQSYFVRHVSYADEYEEMKTLLTSLGWSTSLAKDNGEKGGTDGK